jgi:hypothetical protein
MTNNNDVDLVGPNRPLRFCAVPLLDKSLSG